MRSTTKWTDYETEQQVCLWEARKPEDSL